MPRSPFPKPKKPSHADPDDAPVPRKTAFEDLLCRAIAERRIVILTYRGDPSRRTFAPHAVYTSSKRKESVSGEERGTSGWEPHNFEIGRIDNLSLTDQHFEPDRRLDLFDAKYRNGVRCHV